MNKNFLASKTIQGVLVMALAALARILDIEVADADVQQLAEALVLLAGAVWAVYGRATASKGLTVGKAKVLPVVLLLLLPVVQGCALKNLTPVEQAVAVTDEVTNGYMAVREAYTETLPSLTAERAAQLRAEVAPILDDGRDALVAVRSAVSVWRAVGTKPTDYDALLAKARTAIADAWTVLGRFCPGLVPEEG